ncbi:MAG: hypothetical protein ACR2LN_00865 [Candidatus Levyibacteriota bacterium]
MPKKKKRTLLSTIKLARGGAGNLFVIGIMAGMIGFGAAAVNGLNPPAGPTNGVAVKVVSPTPGGTQTNLQLQTFGYVTIAPTPPPTSTGTICKQGGVNTEPTILVGYAPASGQSVSASGQVKVWVSDENPPFVAPGAVVEPTTGKVTTPGDTTAKADDNFLYSPALYIAPGTVESGGTPHFPDFIKGKFNTNPTGFSRGSFGSGGSKNASQGPAIEPIPPGITPREDDFQSEYLWNVASLGLAAGTYQGEFVIHDGDDNRGVGCVTIQIQ